jgi:dethiobiotin synthase
MKHVVVTGTGTDVGKTFVTAGLLRALRRTGCDAVMQKPFQTGCRRRADGALDRPDLDRVAAVADWQPEPSELPDLCPYLYEPACSPHLAARLAGEVPSVARVVQAARRLAVRHAYVLAETAGGVLVPINAREVMLDWMSELGWPVLVVARAGLGTINETLLTLRALRAVGLECAGVVLNETGAAVADVDDAYIRRDNVEAIRDFGGVPLLATLGFLGAGPKAVEWDRFEAAFDPSIESLFGQP